MKEAEASVLEEFLGPSEFSNHGERVVVGQRLMQATSDIFLGWLHVDSGLDGKPRDFYGRQLKDWKGSAEIEQMVPKAMATYGKLCGWTLARAHARSGDRIAIAALPRQRRQLRPCNRRVLQGLRRTERPRLQGARRGSQIRQDHRQNGPLTHHPPDIGRPAADTTSPSARRGARRPGTTISDDSTSRPCASCVPWAVASSCPPNRAPPRAAARASGQLKAAARVVAYA